MIDFIPQPAINLKRLAFCVEECKVIYVSNQVFLFFLPLLFQNYSAYPAKRMYDLIICIFEISGNTPEYS